MSERFLVHSGPAVGFDDYPTLKKMLDDDDDDITADHVIVLRNAGPKGGPGMPEWDMVPIPQKLLREGVRDMLRVSDARMSGAGHLLILRLRLAKAPPGARLRLRPAQALHERCRRDERATAADAGQHSLGLELLLLDRLQDRGVAAAELGGKKRSGIDGDGRPHPPRMEPVGNGAHRHLAALHRFEPAGEVGDVEALTGEADRQGVHARLRRMDRFQNAPDKRTAIA
jgi:hypothetical protein